MKKQSKKHKRTKIERGKFLQEKVNPLTLEMFFFYCFLFVFALFILLFSCSRDRTLYIYGTLGLKGLSRLHSEK